MGEQSTGVPPDRRRRKGGGDMWSETILRDSTAQENIKFMKMAPVNEGESFFTLNLLQLKHQLPSVNQGLLEVKPFAGNSLLLKVRENSDAMMILSQLRRVATGVRELAVVVTSMDAMNRSRGTIYAPELKGTPTEEIVAENEEILEMEQLSRWNVERQTREVIPAYKITFRTRKTPEHVVIGFMRYQVRTYYDAPRGCLACLSYAHLFRNCPKKETTAMCRKCGLNVGLDEAETKRLEKRVLRVHVCQAPPECPNCPPGRNSHRPTENICPARQREIEVIRIKTDHCLSYREARARVSDSYVASHRSFASTVSQAPTTNAAPTTNPGPSNHQAMQARIDANSATISNLKELVELEKRQLAEIAKMRRELESLRKQRLREEAAVAQLQNEREQPSQDPFGSIASNTPLPSSFSQMPMDEDELQFVGEEGFPKPATLSARTRRGSFSSGSSVDKEPPNKTAKKTAGSVARPTYRTATDQEFEAAISLRPNINCMGFEPVRPEHDPQAMLLSATQMKVVVSKLSKTEAATLTNCLNTKPPAGKKKPKYVFAPTGLHLVWY